jgi:hypothetical protein
MDPKLVDQMTGVVLGSISELAADFVWVFGRR